MPTRKAFCTFASRVIAWFRLSSFFQGNYSLGRPGAVIESIQKGFSRAYIGNGAYTADEDNERIAAASKIDQVSLGHLQCQC